MYRVVLINLSADARAVAARSHRQMPNVSPAALRQLLDNFRAIDPIENSTAGTEIRVQVRQQDYLLQAAHGKLILYDMQQRTLPAQVLALEEALAELDGSATAARNQAIQDARLEADFIRAELAAKARKPAFFRRYRPIWLTAAAVLLLTVHFHGIRSRAIRFPDFRPAEPDDLPTVRRTLNGVYLTGSGPGHHGIVIADPGELKLVELTAVEAPRVVYVRYVLGRQGSIACLATDQPGGLIKVMSDGVLIYCDENYRRIP